MRQRSNQVQGYVIETGNQKIYDYDTNQSVLYSHFLHCSSSVLFDIINILCYFI
jgi:hypothetical protein